MRKPQKRGIAYFTGRLINEHPTVYADFLAGKYPSLTKACQAAGLMVPDTPLKALKRGWTNASSADRKQFVAWIRSTAGAVGPAVVNGYVEVWAEDRVREIMQRRGLAHSDVMDELHTPRLNASLWNAISSKPRTARLRNPALIVALEKWLHDNRAV